MGMAHLKFIELHTLALRNFHHSQSSFYFIRCFIICAQLIHSSRSLSYTYYRSKASTKASCPHTAIQSFLLQMRLSSLFIKVNQ
jgi:hypothetical protein